MGRRTPVWGVYAEICKRICVTFLRGKHTLLGNKDDPHNRNPPVLKSTSLQWLSLTSAFAQYRLKKCAHGGFVWTLYFLALRPGTVEIPPWATFIFGISVGSVVIPLKARAKNASVACSVEGSSQAQLPSCSRTRPFGKCCFCIFIFGMLHH